MKATFLTLIAFTAFLTHAAPVKEITDLYLIFTSQRNEWQHKKIPYQSLTPETHLSLVSPHPTKNPNKTINLWSGVTIRKLLHQQGASTKGSDEITVVGSDSYSVQLHCSDILPFDVILATERDGTKLAWHDGGPQLVYPLSDKRLASELHKDSWWAWYVSAIFIGQPTPRIEVQTETKMSSLILTSTSGTVSTMKRSYPPGKRMLEAPKGNAAISTVPLDRLLEAREGKTIKRTAATTYLGQRVELTKAPNKYELRYLWNGKPISPALGGPVQLCEVGSANYCLFFVKSVHFSSSL